jgi:biotin-dependent carboxylase-like uncharacterized protein
MIEVVSRTPLSSVQDLGRDGYLRYGVGTSGAMDRLALTAGNILLDNPENSAAIETPYYPFEVRFLQDIAFALTGADAAAELDGRPIPPWWVLQARKGQALKLNPTRRGARSYLALAGGIDVPVVLGSRSTQLRGNFGGFCGRNLQKGDVLGAIPLAAQDEVGDRLPAAGFGVEPPEFALPLGDPESVAQATRTFVRVLPAAEYDCYEKASLEAFWRKEWKITLQSDRYGYRLEGEALACKQAVEKRSHGIVPGVIQVPPNGQPIIQLRDAQPSGGYPKIGTVIEADLWRLAQAKLCTQIRFVQTTYDEAVAALDTVHDYLNRVRRLVKLYKLSKR